MDIIQAIILGVIEGLTEFLPISSTGHLIVAEDLLSYKDTAAIFTVVVQSGAIAAVVWLYRRQLIERTKGLFSRDKGSGQFWANWVIATLPAGAVGFILQDTISKYAVSMTVAWALIIGGILIWLIEAYHKPPKPSDDSEQVEKITMVQALKIGLFQIIALIPGVSRSGATIMGGLLSGLDRVRATAFSFYLSIPILLVAGGYQLLSGRNELSTISGGPLALVVGTMTAFVMAMIAIKWLLRYISSHDFKIFAYYRIILGVIVLLALVI